MRPFLVRIPFAPLAAVLLSVGGPPAVAGSPEVPPQALAPAARLSFPMVDLQGAVHELGQNDRGVIRAFVFLSPECPVSNSYLPTLSELWKGVDAGRVHLFGVVTDPTLTRAAVAKHFKEFDFDGPVLFDPAGRIAKVFEPTHVPEAFVLNGDGALVYRGAIDDAWSAVGRGRRAEAANRYLTDAISRTVAKRPVRNAKTEPVGCLFESFSPQDGDAEVTYARDVAPIINARCLSCHRDGQVAPFALGTYEQVAKRADWIAQVTRDRIMPPWIPHPGDESFVGERRLTEYELDVLARWADTGRAKGDPGDLPPPPKFAEGWRLGEPDLVVTMPEPFTVPADGPDLFQNFVIPIDVPADKLVAATEFHPGNKRVVHHSVLFLDGNGSARKLDAATPEPGYSNFGGPGFAPTGALGGWSVGNTPRRLPGGMGRYLAKGSDLVMQIHYHPTGREEVDRSEVGLYFIDKPVEEALSEPAKLVGSFWLANYQMDIPAGEKDYRRTTSYTLPKEVVMVGVVPHMHLLGKSMKVTATLPATDDGQREERTLIDVREWNYNWQDEYYFERPFTLPAGTTLTIDAAFDNSAANPSNPSSPPQRVTWGEETDDEMLFCFFIATATDVGDLIHVIQHATWHDLSQPRADVSNADEPDTE